MSTEYSDVHKGKPDHIDLTAHHTREPDILGKYQIGTIGTPFFSPHTYLENNLSHQKLFPSPGKWQMNEVKYYFFCQR